MIFVDEYIKKINFISAVSPENISKLFVKIFRIVELKKLKRRNVSV